MAEEQAHAFDIRKIYLKDSSVESPNAPGIFLDDPSKPEVSIEASIKTAKLDQDDFFEVVLGMTVTSKMGEKTAFLVEVLQAGVFHISGLTEEDIPLALEIACPNILLPFAREAISDLVGKAGFPQLLLSPINFEALFQQKQAQLKAASEEASQQEAPAQ
ncbi:protein-export chaperone SecB [Arenicella sp. 4NH20-0111]|uniref:protein-export chaperone SecB n=1 Tax=Arenicella sp. 4NH20-0111 TaxID=3127648 RepID=UPI003105C0D3